MFSPRVLSVLGLAAIACGSVQQPFFNPAGQPRIPGSFAKPQHAVKTAPSFGAGFEAYDAGLFTPFEDLSALSTEEFTTLAHPLFPHYNVRIKQSTFCDGSARAYTGYIDREARHIFFYFFESRNDPSTDDVIFWTNGGPGCSSSLGLFMELGPCRVNSPHNVTHNPYSWNENANVFFVDQPVGVGFSYADYGESVETTEEAAKDIAAFVAIFFEHFSQFKGRPFHMAGESYGGRYIPVFASEIFDQNAQLEASGLEPVNLTSVMIGNGCTHWPTMVGSYYDMQCKNVSVPPIQDVSACVRMKQSLSRCEKWMNSCDDSFNEFDCEAASLFCSNEIESPFFATGYNPYDISKPCDGPIQETLCYPVTKSISAFLDRKDVRRTLGVDSSVGNFSSCNNDVNAAFHARWDGMFPTQYYIAALLERGVRALIYVGANDWICNWVGNERMTLGLEWTGQAAFVAQPLREWEVNGTAAGLTRSAGPFTFATIFGAGHMVPYDKPLESLELVKRWLAKEDL
ncbi:serine carboxypeptidase [Obba rivulosa]|uniref:Carboxypeptidase n=1 Tax=Obba rivulosa TaxID=1052685 RepID=A0A8E2B1G9_9APHY|nr:serine carboxypeptidase [Obba rivulosa]